MAERDTNPTEAPKTLVDKIRVFTNSKLKAQQLEEKLQEEYYLIPKTGDPLAALVKEGVVRHVGTVCSHGLGGGVCPFGPSEPLHRQAPAYADINAPETSDYPVPLATPASDELQSLLDLAADQEGY